jgi:hypothetical protein
MPLDVVYFNSLGAVLAVIVVPLVFVAALAQLRWNLHDGHASVFMEPRAGAIKRARNTTCIVAIRAQVRWQKPEWDSSIWMSADLCLSSDQLIIIPDLASAILLSSPFRARLGSYVVPRARLTGAKWIENPIWPGWRRIGTGDRTLAVSTDAGCKCYVGSSRTHDLQVLLNALLEKADI